MNAATIANSCSTVDKTGHAACRSIEGGAVGDGCLLCEALKDSTSDAPEVWNRVILDTTMFSVLPAIGPLVPGHVMVVSKTHHPSLAAMGMPGLNGYEEVLTALRDRWPHLTNDLLEAEHGGVPAVKAGPCIIHTHINILPLASNYLNILDKELSVVCEGSKLSTILERKSPYFLMRSGSLLRLYDGRGGQSQLVRRAISELQGRVDWNWAIYPREDWIRETVAMWA